MSEARVLDPRDASARARAGLSSLEIDTLRGFFIVLVVIGHNVLLTASIPGLFRTLYSFHIYAFLFLPFVFPAQPLSPRDAGDRAVRYLVPHTIFYLLAAASFTLLFRRDDPVGAVLSDVTVAWIVSSGREYKDACGYVMFWFLPALLSLVLVRSLWCRLPSGWRVALLAVLVLAHGFVGDLPTILKRYVPFGLLIVVFVFPLGLAVEWLWDRARNARRVAAPVALAIFAVGVSVFAATGSESRIGSLELYSWRDPWLLALCSTVPVAAFIGSAASGHLLARLPALASLGRVSLVIYLSHSLIFHALHMAIPRAWLRSASPETRLGVAIASAAATIAAAWLLATVIERSAVLRRCVTPRDVGEWPPTARLLRG